MLPPFPCGPLFPVNQTLLGGLNRLGRLTEIAVTPWLHDFIRPFHLPPIMLSLVQPYHGRASPSGFALCFYHLNNCIDDPILITVNLAMILSWIYNHTCSSPKLCQLLFVPLPPNITSIELFIHEIPLVVRYDITWNFTFAEKSRPKPKYKELSSRVMSS